MPEEQTSLLAESEKGTAEIEEIQQPSRGLDEDLSEKAHPGCDLVYCFYNLAKRCDTTAEKRAKCAYWTHMEKHTRELEERRKKEERYTVQ